MDPWLAYAFTEILDEVLNKPLLGNATTGQLLDEVKARVNCNYRTVDGDNAIDPDANPRQTIKSKDLYAAVDRFKQIRPLGA